MTKDAYFSLLTRTKQLLLITFCDTLAGIEVSFWADGTERTDGRTDGRGSRNSYLDIMFFSLFSLDRSWVSNFPRGHPRRVTDRRVGSGA